MKPDYDTTVARIAGNIMPALVNRHLEIDAKMVKLLVAEAVMLAREIVSEVKRTQPLAPASGEK